MMSSERAPLSVQTPAVRNLLLEDQRSKKRKRPRLHAALGTMLLRLVSLLLRRIGRCRRLGCRSGCRLGAPGWGLSRRGRRRRHAGLHVVGFDHRLRNIDGLAVPDDRSLRPGLRGVNDHAEAVLTGILHDYGSHLSEDSLHDLALLILSFLAGVLHGALEDLLLGLDLLAQCSGRVLVHLVALGAELFLESVDLVAHGLELGLLGLEFLGEDIEIAASLVGAKNCSFNADGADLGAGSSWDGGGSRGCVRYGGVRSGSSGRGGLG